MALQVVEIDLVDTVALVSPPQATSVVIVVVFLPSAVGALLHHVTEGVVFDFGAHLGAIAQHLSGCDLPAGTVVVVALDDVLAHTVGVGLQAPLFRHLAGGVVGVVSRLALAIDSL